LVSGKSKLEFKLKFDNSMKNSDLRWRFFSSRNQVNTNILLLCSRFCWAWFDFCL